MPRLCLRRRPSLIRAGALTFALLGCSREKPRPVARPTTPVPVIGVLGALAVDGDSVADSLSNSWTAGVPMPAPRAHHVLVATGGRLLAIGGRDESARPTATTFELSSGAKAWPTRAPMPDARTGSAAAVAADGDVFVFGGQGPDTSYVATTLRYSPRANAWTRGADLPAAGGCGSADRLDSVLYLFVGCDASGAPARRVYRYDPKAGTFAAVAAPTLDHVYGSLVNVRGSLVLTGGRDASGEPTAAVERYDAANNRWLAIASMNGPRFGHGAVFVRQALVVTDGARAREGHVGAEYLDPMNATWLPRPAPPHPATFAGTAALGGRVFVAGGADAEGRAQVTVDVYTPGDYWLEGPPMPTPREASVAGEINGVIYVVGGFMRRGGLVTTNEAYDARTSTWSTRAPLPVVKGHAMAAVAGGKLYVIGGNDQSPPNRTSTNTVYAYDPSTNAWAPRAPMPVTGAWGGTAATVAGKIYVTAGSSGKDVRDGDPSPKVYAYDPVADSWAEIPPLADGSHGASAAGIGATLYLVGGHGTTDARRDLRVFATDAGAWSRRSDAPVGTTFSTVAATRHALFVIGGANKESYALSATQRYDITLDRWTERAALPVGIVSTVSAESGGVIYLFGGKTEDKRVTGRVFAYVP